jgi:hypothetical protein
MPNQIKMSDIRAKFPMYSDLPDDQLLIGVHKAYYPDIPMGDFTKRIQYDAPAPEPMGPLEKVGQVMTNLGAGAVRGAGSIGATLVDAARGLGSSAIDATPAAMRPQGADAVLTDPRGKELRAGIDAGLQQAGQDANLPVDPHSLAFQGGKITAEVAGTAGAGGMLGKAAEASGMAAPVVEALTTGGMKAGGMTGAGGLAVRAGAGAVNGAVAGGMVDPEHAGESAIAGGALPMVAKGLGAVGEKMGATSAAKATQDAQKLAVARAAAEQGYVVPPVDLQPGLMTKMLSGLSGKIKTSQVASQRNQEVTDRLARQALGLDPAAELTPDALQQLRQKAGGAYEALRGAGQVTADQPFLSRLDQIAAVSKGASRSFPGLGENGVDDLIGAVRQPTFDAGDAIDAISLLRDKADKAFRQGDTTVGRAAKGAATALEDQLQRHLEAAGNPGMLNAFQQARQQIAKSYSVQSALNPSTGSVAAPKLAQQLQKGKPLSGDLETIARFGQAFPKASQMLKEDPGSVSPLDWLAAGSSMMGAHSGPVGAAVLAARPLVRQALLSGPVQARALAEAAPTNPAIEQALQALFPLSARALPALVAGRE